jgi:hypothetical protein
MSNGGSVMLLIFGKRELQFQGTTPHYQTLFKIVND